MTGASVRRVATDEDRLVELERRVAELEEANEALAAAESKYRTLVESAGDAIVILQDGEMVYCNESYRDFVGFDVGGGNFLGGVAPEDRERVRERHERRLRGELVRDCYELDLLTPAGERVPVEVKVRVIEYGGRPAAQATMRDISERRAREAALAEAKAHYRLLFERSKDAVALTTLNGRLRDVNQAALDLFGFASREELLSTRPRDLVPNRNQAQKLAALLQENGFVQDFEIEARDRQGARLLLRTTSTLIAGDGENTLQHIFRDITYERRLERHLIEARRLEAVGRLAGGIAHDFNNLLTVILGTSELLLGEESIEGLTAEQIQQIGHIGGAARKASLLTQQLLAVGRRQMLEPRLVDLNEVVGRASHLAERSLGADIETRTTLYPSRLVVRVDPRQIEQVVLSLATNARDAMAGSGVFSLRTSLVELDEAAARGLAAGLRPGGYAVVAVHDTGIGLSARDCERVFEPFFSTKERGTGKGLGLATARGIVEQSGGTITVESAPGSGSCFRIFLPRASGLATAVSQPQRAASPPHRERLLLVEDEDAVRGVIRRQLANAGYSVVDTGDPEEALRLCDEGVRLLVTDMVMPGMSGSELARRLQRKYAGLKVLLMSGYADDVIREADAGMSFLAKPFANGSLVKKVREVLQAG